ncbi:MAG TPA: chromosomal replication initiator protein DnaA [Chloroflexi bacterium]|nr:chromosomal replication initiator protein DnaA [Chloroflexota bacterium]
MTTSKPEQIWKAALGELQLQMAQTTYDTWLRDTHLLRCEDHIYVIGVKNGYAKEWLEHRLLSIIKRTLTRLAGRTVEVRFVVAGNSAPQSAALFTTTTNSHSTSLPEDQSGGTSNPSTVNIPPRPNLNPRYIFDTFVVGPGNRLAQAASLAVTETPGSAYNPLFIYGGVGLGKTHLLHAIGHRCYAQGLNVLYTSSEKFTNDLIAAIRSHTTDGFREKYRTVDILMVDDIQFIAGKESTQEEFFHTFNTLHGTGKQIVISSDRPPKAMSTLEERLCSRFEWGLITDIQPPDLETRIAILQAKAESYQVSLPNDVLYQIANRVQSNIRELEGALNRVLAMAQLTHQPLNEEMVASALHNFLPQHTPPTPEQILEEVAYHFGLDITALQGRSRNRSVARPRQIAMYLIREETGESLPRIGALLGGRDHTTVLHGYERIAELIEEDTNLRRDILTLRQNLYSNTH